MSFVKFKLTSRDAKYPHTADSRPGWLFYPCFDSDHLVIRPGDTAEIDCGVSVVNDNDNLLWLSEYPDGDSELMLHPSAVADGEEVKLRLTNVSRNVCVIAKPDFDVGSRIGHGIYRSAVIIPYDRPAARGFLWQIGTDAEKPDDGGTLTV